jgi:hypothetical protein
LDGLVHLPRFTVIIPTYNWSAVLPYSIGSVLRQTFGDFELLVIGDGCTDDSETVVKSIKDSRVRWTNLPTNSGHQSAANNEGLRQARGEYIAYLGHDDLWLPHHLSTMAAALDAGADVAYGIVELVQVDGTCAPAPKRLTGYVPGMWIPPSGVVHRRQAALDAGGWPLFAEVNCDPEIALLDRMHTTGDRIEFVRRLVAIKFPAATRRNAYRILSTTEQAAWSQRIASEGDLEIVELVRMLPSEVDGPPTANPFSRTLQTFMADVSSRIRRRLVGAPSPLPPPTRTEVFNKRREFKGLVPKAPPGGRGGVH